MMRTAGVLVLLASAAVVRAEGVAIEHEAVGCVVAGKHPQIVACFAPPSELARARVYFRADGSPYWYFVPMSSSAPCFVGTLPKPRSQTKRIVYYVQAVDRHFAETRTADAAPEVVGSAAECQNVPVAAFANKAAVSVSAAAGSPLVPIGFVAGAGIGVGTIAVIGGGAAVAGGVLAAGGGPTSTAPPVAVAPPTVSSTAPPAPPAPTPDPVAPTPGPTPTPTPTPTPSPTPTPTPTPTPGPFTLTLTKTSGLNLLHNVTDNFGQISCGTGCNSATGTYPGGTVVVLTEQPGLLVFRGWSGACSGTGTTCTVVMTGDKAVHATFALLLTEPPPPPSQWTSVLEAPGAVGNVSVNGAPPAGVARAAATIVTSQGPGEMRVQGVLTAATGPGAWRFERQAAGGPAVRFKVLEGQVSLVTPDVIVFRLRGQPGERIAFTIVPVP